MASVSFDSGLLEKSSGPVLDWLQKNAVEMVAFHSLQIEQHQLQLTFWKNVLESFETSGKQSSSRRLSQNSKPPVPNGPPTLSASRSNSFSAPTISTSSKFSPKTSKASPKTFIGPSESPAKFPSESPDKSSEKNPRARQNSLQRKTQDLNNALTNRVGKGRRKPSTEIASSSAGSPKVDAKKMEPVLSDDDMSHATMSRPALNKKKKAPTIKKFEEVSESKEATISTDRMKEVDSLVLTSNPLAAFAAKLLSPFSSKSSVPEVKPQVPEVKPQVPEVKIQSSDTAVSTKNDPWVLNSNPLASPAVRELDSENIAIEDKQDKVDKMKQLGSKIILPVPGAPPFKPNSASSINAPSSTAKPPVPPGAPPNRKVSQENITTPSKSVNNVNSSPMSNVRKLQEDKIVDINSKTEDISSKQVIPPPLPSSRSGSFKEDKNTIPIILSPNPLCKVALSDIVLEENNPMYKPPPLPKQNSEDKVIDDSALKSIKPPPIPPKGHDESRKSIKPPPIPNTVKTKNTDDSLIDAKRSSVTSTGSDISPAPPNPIFSRPPPPRSNGTNSSRGVPTTVSQILAAAVDSSLPRAAGVKCSECGCDSFVPHSFKKKDCNICYHQHGPDSVAERSSVTKETSPSVALIADQDTSACKDCGCTTFQPHSFKKKECNICYHQH